MDIHRASDRPTRKGSTEWFTGTVWQDPIIDAPEPARIKAVRVGLVTPAPCAPQQGV